MRIFCFQKFKCLGTRIAEKPRFSVCSSVSLSDSSLYVAGRDCACISAIAGIWKVE
jgi:hypothetical protein